jgi:hypothetical protein
MCFERGDLEVMLLGAVPLARNVGGAAANQGEALRYLAELPWSPEAILLNRALDCTVVDARTVRVATGLGAERGEVTFELDDDGLIVRVRAVTSVFGERTPVDASLARPILGLPARGRPLHPDLRRGRLYTGRRRICLLARSHFVFEWCFRKRYRRLTRRERRGKCRRGTSSAACLLGVGVFHLMRQGGMQGRDRPLPRGIPRCSEEAYKAG